MFFAFHKTKNPPTTGLTGSAWAGSKYVNHCRPRHRLSLCCLSSLTLWIEHIKNDSEDYRNFLKIIESDNSSGNICMLNVPLSPETSKDISDLDMSKGIDILDRFKMDNFVLTEVLNPDPQDRKQNLINNQ